MTDVEPENTDGNPTDQATDETEPRSHKSIAVWLTGPIIIIALAILAFAIYLASSGIDMAWAVGTSGWIAPPGSRLAGKDIGGKSLDDVDGILGELASEFANLSVWISEDPYLIDLAPGAFPLSSADTEVALSVTPLEFGISLDLNKMSNRVAALDATSNDIWALTDRLTLWTEPPEIPVILTLDDDKALACLEGVRSTVDCEPVEALLDLANRQIIPAMDGIEVDVAATLENIPLELDTLIHIPITLVTSRTPPDITDEDFDGIDIDTPLASYTTNFATYKRNRSFNISLAASHFEGVVLGPGEILSFDDITGPRGYSQDYRSAPMYINRRIEMEPAGGACQVSTTLYNAAILAGLEITERWPHSRPCSYVPYGRDATVAWGAVDLKFKNNLTHPIIIHQVVDYLGAGTITFEIFGHPDDRVHVEIGNAYSWIGRPESTTTYIIDTSLAPGEEVVEDRGVSGIHQRAWRTWFDDAGNELYTEDLSNDNIRPVGAVIRHNPGPSGLYPPADSGAYTSPEPPPDDTPKPPGPDDPAPTPPGVF